MIKLLKQINKIMLSLVADYDTTSSSSSSDEEDNDNETKVEKTENKDR